mgnify:FL=1
MDRVKRFLLASGTFPVLVVVQAAAWCGASPAGMLAATGVMLLFCTAALVAAFRRDGPSHLDWAATVYCAAALIGLILCPEATSRLIQGHSATALYALFFFSAFLPPLFGAEPFTCRFARRSTPSERWDNPIFMKINRIMTNVWAGIFVVCFLLSLHTSPWLGTAVPLLLMLGVGLPFNARFPDHYLRRLGLPSLREQRRPPREGARANIANLAAMNLHEEERQAPTVEEPARSVHGRVNHGHANKEERMKALALNSSPRGDGKSKTGLLLTHLVQGMRAAGAEVEVMSLRDKNVQNCIGCFSCWTKTPGRCILKDDMSAELYPKWLEADLVIYASPLYYYAVNATMKAFIERTLPVLQPFFEEREGATHHPMRREHPPVVMLSVAGFPEATVFEQLSSWASHVFGERLVAEIYRPAAESMTEPAFADAAGDALEGAVQAGRELVLFGKILPETMGRVTRPLFDDLEAYRTIGNLMWKTCISEGVAPGEMEEKGIMILPDSIETFMVLLPMGFNPEGAEGVRAVLQFDFTGEVEGSCHFKIEDGKMEAFEGPAANPTLTIETPFELWLDVMAGRADGQELFLQRKYTARGDLSLLARMKELFKG